MINSATEIFTDTTSFLHSVADFYQNCKDIFIKT